MNTSVINIAAQIKNPGKQAEAHLEFMLSGLGICGRELVPTGAAVVDMKYSYDGNGGVNAHGVINCVFSENCARCGKEFDLPMSVEFSERFIRLGRGNDTLSPDDDAFTFSGELLDIEDFVREMVLLSYPIAPVCSEDCEGLGIPTDEDEVIPMTDSADEDSSSDDDFQAKLEALKKKYS